MKRPRPRSPALFASLLWIAAGYSNATTAVAQQPPSTTPAASPGGKRMLEESDVGGLTWRSIGPANMGGRVADIALAPGNAKTFFIAFGTGGLFKTTNCGTTFEPVFDKYETASIGSVVVADAPPGWPGWQDEEKNAKPGDQPGDREKAGKAKVVWVGTGEGNNRNSSSWGHGVYRSTDGGDTFKNVGLVDSHNIPRIAVDPRDPDVCYVAAQGHLWGPNKERGVYKTSDGGQTWQPVLQIDEDTGACDVIIDPQDPDIVLAAMYTRRRTAYSFQSGSTQGGVFRSKDAGQTWQKLSNGLPARTGRIGIDVYRSNTQIVYAVVESDEGGWGPDTWDDRSKTGGVFRSEDRGDTWTRVFDRAPRGFYFSKIRIDPTDDQRIYLLGWGVSVSDDGGRTFRAGGASVAHVDMHAMVIDPADPDHLLIGNDGGCYVSYDRGKTWVFLNQIAAGEFYNIAVDLSDPYRVVGGLQDNGTWFGPSATMWTATDEYWGRAGGITNADWHFVNDGDGFHAAFDPTDPNVIYAESQGGELARVHLDTAVRKLIKPAPKEGEPRFRFNWNAPFFVSPHDPTVLYLGGNYVFKLSYGGDRWQRISDDLTTNDVAKIQTVGSDAETHCTVVSLAESPLANGMIWAGSDDGLMHVTTDDGQTWTEVTPPQAQGRYVSRIEPSHHDRNTAYISLDAHRSDDFEPYVLMTSDAGQSWASITGDLAASVPVKVIREDLTNPDVLYAGTETSVQVSIDRGRHWVRLNGKSLPTVAVDDVIEHPREKDLIVGTHGRSIYILDDASAFAQLSADVLDSALHLFDIPTAKPHQFLPYGDLWSDRMFIAKNPEFGARITYWLRDFTNDEIKITIKDENDVKVRELTGTNRRGINRVVWDLLPDKKDRFSSPDQQLGQKTFVPPGKYTVMVTLGEDSVTKTVQVLAAPGASSQP